jgi:hypothetical protein
MPKSAEWLSDKDAATYYDRYSGDHNIDKAKQMKNEAQ